MQHGAPMLLLRLLLQLRQLRVLGLLVQGLLRLTCLLWLSRVLGILGQGVALGLRRGLLGGLGVAR